MATNKEQTITIRDVARIAGVSIKTVSRVSSGEQHVSEATRAHVLKIIKQTGYVPNASARSMRSKRSWLIGLVYPKAVNSFTSAIHSGALKACEKYQFGLATYPSERQEAQLLKALDTLRLRSQVEGILLAAPFAAMKCVREWLNDHQMPHAMIAPPASQHPKLYSFANNREAAFQMAEHLIKLGHRRIGFIAGPDSFTASTERQAGFEEACLAHGITVSESYIARGDFTLESGVAAGRQLLQLKKPPTAIFCSNDNMAIGLMHEAHERGMQLPRELSISGFDDIGEASFVYPPLTTVRQPLEDMAEGAVASLIQHLQDKKSEPVAKGYFCELIVRKSTAPPP